MPSVEEIEEIALRLPDDQRALLASHLLESLPGILVEEDEGLSEALRRDAQFDSIKGLSLDEMNELVSKRRL